MQACLHIDPFWWRISAAIIGCYPGFQYLRADRDVGMLFVSQHQGFLFWAHSHASIVACKVFSSAPSLQKHCLMTAELSSLLF